MVQLLLWYECTECFNEAPLDFGGADFDAESLLGFDKALGFNAGSLLDFDTDIALGFVEDTGAAMLLLDFCWLLGAVVKSCFILEKEEEGKRISARDSSQYGLLSERSRLVPRLSVAEELGKKHHLITTHLSSLGTRTEIRVSHLKYKYRRFVDSYTHTLSDNHAS